MTVLGAVYVETWWWLYRCLFWIKQLQCQNQTKSNIANNNNKKHFDGDNIVLNCDCRLFPSETIKEAVPANRFLKILHVYLFERNWRVLKIHKAWLEYKSLRKVQKCYQTWNENQNRPPPKLLLPLTPNPHIFCNSICKLVTIHMCQNTTLQLCQLLLAIILEKAETRTEKCCSSQDNIKSITTKTFLQVKQWIKY